MAHSLPKTQRCGILFEPREKKQGQFMCLPLLMICLMLGKPRSALEVKLQPELNIAWLLNLAQRTEVRVISLP